MILKELSEIANYQSRIAFVKANKKALLKEKRMRLKTASPIVLLPKVVKGETATKRDGSGETEVYEIVGNSIGFMDSHMDVSMPGSFTKTVSENGNRIPILINHNHSPEGIFAKNLGTDVKEIPIKSLGYNAEGNTTVVSSKISPLYDEKMRELYKGGEIRQHSVGIQYVKLELAINDSSDNEGFANWQKYLPEVINREIAEESGYFFAILEQKLLEISAVLFGSNEYTPTINESLEEEPVKSHSGNFEPIPNLKEIWNNLN